MTRKRIVLALAALALVPILAQARGGPGGGGAGGGAAGCAGLPSQAQLKTALIAAVAAEQSGLDFEMWATIVNRDGVVCAVAFSGADRQSQWPGSRVISAQKANTANAFSLGSPTTSSLHPTGLALSTANLYSAVQPGGSLYGLQHSNPVNTDDAYGGNPVNDGQANDFMVGGRIGGVNVFGGGLALYNASHQVVGGLGVSGDTSCADHMIAWRTRNNLGLDHLTGVGGVANDPLHPDNIIYDIAGGVSASGFGHPVCLNTGDQTLLPPVAP
jgi:uncharacterized protein GlcG (DUF336 family)